MRRGLAETRWVWLVRGIAVLLLDAGGAVASGRRGFEYRSPTPVSFILCSVALGVVVTGWCLGPRWSAGQGGAFTSGRSV